MKQLLAKYVCLVIFSFVSLGQVTGAPTANEIGKIVDIPTLGRPVMLGELYSAHSDVFLPGFSLWGKDDIEQGKRVIWNPSSYMDFSADTSRTKKEMDLNVGGSLSGSFAAGFIHLSGSAKVLDNTEDDEDSTSVTLSYKSISRTETLSSNLTKNTDTETPHCKLPVNKNSEPTHIVGSITYGGNCHFKFQKKLKEKDDKLEINGKLSVKIKIGFSLNGKSQLDFSDQNDNFTEDLTLQLYSDFILEKQPLNFNDTLKIYQDISSNFGTKGSNYNESVPMSMVLIPLKLFCTDSGLAAEISKDILKRATDVRITLLQVLDKIAKLLDSRPAVGNFKVRLLLLDFQSDVANYTLSYEAELQKNIIGARNPNIAYPNEAELVKLIDSYTNSPYDYDKYLYPYLTEKTRQVNAINIFYDQTVLQNEPQIAVYSKADIPQAIITEPIVFVLTLYVLPDVKAEKYSAYINQTSQQDIETWLEDGWYNNRATVGEVGTAWRNFKTFFEINEYEDGTHYFVLLEQEETNKTIMNLQLYVDGVETPFQLAEVMKLSLKPRVSRAGSKITITVDDPPANLLSTIDQFLVIVTKTPSDNLYPSTPTLLKVDIDKPSNRNKITIPDFWPDITSYNTTLVNIITSTVITIPDLVPEYSYNVTVAYSTEYGSFPPSKVVTTIGEFDKMEKTIGCKIEDNKKKTDITFMENSSSATDYANICRSESRCTDGWTFQLGVGNCYRNDAGSNSTNREGWAVGTKACGVEIETISKSCETGPETKEWKCPMYCYGLSPNEYNSVGNVGTWEACGSICKDDPQCLYWTWSHHNNYEDPNMLRCYLFDYIENIGKSEGAIGGTKCCY